MGKLSLSQAVYENLARHLTQAEEEKSKIFDLYFPEPSKDRNDFEDLYESYIRQVNELVTNADKSETFGFEVPFVVIGSTVEVQDLMNNEVINYRIVNPFWGSTGINDVSCLSPMGRSLLLKKAGDEIEVNAPGGLFRYKVISIRMSADTE